MKKRLILITSIVTTLLVMGIYIKVETQTKPAQQRLTYPYHVKIFMCPLSVYFTQDNPSNTLRRVDESNEIVPLRVAR